MRLGIYNDDVYRVSDVAGTVRVSADRAFLLFACEVGRHFDSVVLFGRTVRSDVQADYVLPGYVELAELPHYADLRQLRRLAKVSIRTIIEMWHAVARVDCVWVFGPHPFAAPLIAIALARKRSVVLGVRFDAIQYYRARLPSRRWWPVLLIVWTLDLLFRALSRWLPTTVVGSEIAKRYGRHPRSVLQMTVSLVRDHEVAERPADLDWNGQIQLLTIGRLDREKNPLLLIEAMAELEWREPGRFRLIWIGRGPLEGAFAQHSKDLGIDTRIELHGYVPFGSALFAMYRRSHMFVHTSLTEGVPQVIIEALAFATPIVATDVGGVRAALDSGAAGVLVPPSNCSALVAAILRVAADEELRSGLVKRGLELARLNTLDAQAMRTAEFIAGSVVRT